MKIHNIKKKIVPYKLIINTSGYNIELLDLDYIIKEFEVHVNDKNKVDKIKILKGKHPNCDPETKEFCTPDIIKEKEFSDNLITEIEKMFQTFNYNSSYEQKWNILKLHKMEKY